MEQRYNDKGMLIRQPIFFYDNISSNNINTESNIENNNNQEGLIEYPSYVDYSIVSIDEKNPTLRSPNTSLDLPFYQTKETLSDPETYRNFIKNAEARFRRSKEYKTYKSYLMSLGFDHCQIMGNIQYEDGVDIELHHNILNLFDDMILICEHVLNTIGHISTFDLIELTIKEHYANRIPIVFLSSTAHQMYTNDENGYIPPDMTFGKWWELLSKYRYGITFDIAKKVNTYIERYRHQIPVSIDIQQQEQILNFAYYNEYGEDNSQYNLIQSQSQYHPQISQNDDLLQ